MIYEQSSLVCQNVKQITIKMWSMKCNRVKGKICFATIRFGLFLRFCVAKVFIFFFICKLNSKKWSSRGFELVLKFAHLRW